MRDWITLALVAAAFTLMGVLGGVAIAPTPVPVVPAPVPTVTATVTVTPRPVARANRSKPVRKPAPTVGVSGKYQAYARARVESSEWPCLRKLWERESSWRPKALGPVNPNGKRPGGIPQILGMNPSTPWREQIDRGLRYVGHRYGGDACVALSHSDKTGWY
jgi:hypothetical protein